MPAGPDSSDDALADLEATFAVEGLGRPPVPLALRARLRRLGDWCWSTRADVDGGRMYGFGEYEHEALTGEPGNYVAVSHGGHGINSYGITYLLVYGRLTVLAQAPWGGAYHSSEEAAGVSSLLERCSRLIGAYESYAAAGLLPPPPARLIVVDHMMNPPGSCGWLWQPLADDDVDRWLSEHVAAESATAAAVELLERAANPTRQAAARPPADLSAFTPRLQTVIRNVLGRHPELPRPGPDYAAWITGCLGDPGADVWFVAENPSAGAAGRAGDDASVEDQWRITPGDRLFRRALVDFGFKDGPLDAPGGWRCYITDVVKSPYDVGEWNARTDRERREVARWWAPVLDAELALGDGRVIVTLGQRARDLLALVEREGLVRKLPKARVAIDHYVYVQSRPRRGVPGGDSARIEEWRQRFQYVAGHPDRSRSARRGASGS